MNYEYAKSNALIFSPDVYITSVTFPISRYGKHYHTIAFDEPVTDEAAVIAAETYLGKAVTKTYYNKVKNDLGYGIDDYAAFEFIVSTRGELIDSLCFLERIAPIENDNDDYGAVKLIIDS